MKKSKTVFKKLAIAFLVVAAICSIIVYFYMKQERFGKLPSGERLALIEKSPNYRDGKFHNIHEKPTMAEGYSMVSEAWKAITKKYPRTEPTDIIPSVKTDLKNLPNDQDYLVWFGHSSFLMQVDGIKFLVDPVFSGNASPIAGSVKAYKGTDVYSVEDMPEIDYLLISHDHYDHLDYETIKALNQKVKKVVCGLGVGEHFEFWGYPKEKIIEKDWGEETKLNDSISLFTERTHHNCGRGLVRDKALWVSFVLKTPNKQIFYTGDGGYDDRFKEIYKKYGAMDWAIMEFGQYNEAWESVHELPHQVIQATEELHAKNLMTVHHSKFTLAKHTWDEPLKKATELSQGKNYRLVTPMIGETLWLDNHTQVFKKWWVGLD